MKPTVDRLIELARYAERLACSRKASDVRLRSEAEQELDEALKQFSAADVAIGVAESPTFSVAVCERIKTFSAYGAGVVTISASPIVEGWEVHASRKIVHGYADHKFNGTGSTESIAQATVRIDSPSPAGLEKAVLAAIEACEQAAERWPIGTNK